MHRQGEIDGHVVEKSGLHDPLAAGAVFFARLEEQDDPPGQPLAAETRQRVRGAEGGRDVRVVPAGVHPPRMGGTEIAPLDLVERQPVHVGAQQHGRPRPGARQLDGDPGPGDPGPRREREPAQRPFDVGRRFALLERQFGNAVQRAAMFDDERRHGARRGGEASFERREMVVGFVHGIRPSVERPL